jgi:hypothetical protein
MRLLERRKQVPPIMQAAYNDNRVGKRLLNVLQKGVVPRQEKDG